MDAGYNERLFMVIESFRKRLNLIGICNINLLQGTSNIKTSRPTLIAHAPAAAIGQTKLTGIGEEGV
jgi:hypothetical protein